MVIGSEHRLRESELSRHPSPSVAAFPGASVKLLNELRARNMKLVRIDADNRSVALMHSNYLKCILPSEINVVIELIPAQN